ncbi:MAG: endonuclease [Bacteroidales bacterium]|nr:endonuclease [Bacteroidales bacterium]
MMKPRALFSRIGLAAVLFFAVSTVFGAKDTAYYREAIGKSRYELKTALYNIIKGHTVVSYDGLWEAYKKTDARADGKVWDMYSNCDFTFDSGHSNRSECDGYNREHSFPKSWFNEGKPMYSDLFHLYPTDCYVNSRRSNYPYGEVSNPTYTSHNGSKVGNNSTPGYSDKVFEPVDEYKGDFARTYFYMATRYEDKIANWSKCPVCDGNNKASFKKWTVELLLKWHRQDPVSQKEIDRNEAVYGYQHNRNPFIDFPELVEKIWGDDNTAFSPYPRTPEEPEEPTATEDPSAVAYRIYPNPTGGMLTLDVEENNYHVRVFTAAGVEVMNLKALNGKTKINLEGMAKGIYVVEIATANGTSRTKVVLR